MKRMMAIALTVLVGASVSWAQETPAVEGIKPLNLTSGGVDFKKAQSALRSLFDSKRLSMSHTFGMGFGSGSTGGTNQYYLNTMTYQFTPKLTAVAQVGIQHHNLGSAFGPSGARTQVIVPNLGLLYTPKPNMRIEFQMSQMPSYGYSRSYDHPYDLFNER
ncbi:MAG: hypothetical protein EXS64_17500 [Candidatus Latescibacteria bacterium]|nr:hypothetical protein [Candidatus Latescibacterota bacterium]